MADFSKLLAGETAEEVAEAYDSGITEAHQEMADHIRSGKFEDLISRAHGVSEQKQQQLALEADKIRRQNNGKGYFCVTG